MKILVLGGVHGNELLGVQLVKLLKQMPLEGVDVCIANPRAVKTNKRFAETDLNRSFGKHSPLSYEEKRARSLQKICANYDVVFDFHNTLTSLNDCAFVGEGCNLGLLQTVKALGFRRCIEATYNCINKYCPNAVSIEISVDSVLNSSQYWYEILSKITQGSTGKTSRQLTIYKFQRRVTWEEKRILGIKGWKAFKKINANVSSQFGLSGTIVPIFIGSTLTEYYATLLSKERVE